MFIEILAVGVLAILAGGAYRFARRKDKEKKKSVIQSEGLMPKPNYLTFVPQKDIGGFVPPWHLSEEANTFKDTLPEVEIEFEDEPIKRFSTSLYPTAFDALLASVGPLHTLSQIDWDVVNAIDFSSKEDLSQYADLEEFVSRHMVDLAPGDGWYTRLHGYVAEQVAGSALADAGHSVEFPELSNQPGFDLVVDGRFWQVKAGSDPQAILDHLDRYPDIPVITSPEIAAQLPQSPDIVALHELDHDMIAGSISDTMTTIDHGDFSGGMQFPLITGLFSSYREIDLLLSGRTNLSAALKNAGLDMLGTAGGGAIGAKIGAALGAFGGLVGSTVGAVLGGIAGALFGRTVTNDMKLEPFKAAVAAYSAAVRDNIETPIESSRKAVEECLKKRQESLSLELRRTEEYVRPLILSEKEGYRRKATDFVRAFGDILVALELELVVQRTAVLGNIRRSTRMRQLLWPTKQDIYYDLVDSWFASRIAFVCSRKSEFEYMKDVIESDEELKRRMQEILSFVNDNPFRNQQLEEWLRNLETEFNQTIRNIDALRHKAKMIGEIQRKSQLELIKAELARTNANLAALLKKNSKRVMPLYRSVAKEAGKLKIDINPSTA